MGGAQRDCNEFSAETTIGDDDSCDIAAMGRLQCHLDHVNYTLLSRIPSSKIWAVSRDPDRIAELCRRTK